MKEGRKVSSHHCGFQEAFSFPRDVGSLEKHVDITAMKLQ